MKKIPFYPNQEDNMHCSIAVYRMLFEYFLKRKTSWEEMDKMAGFANGRAPWTVTIWERFASQGFDIRMIGAFNYERYAKEGDAYLRAYFTPEEYEWQLKHTNIADIKPYLSSFLERVKLENRYPTIQDVDNMLADGRLVHLTLNSRALHGKDGYVSHAVLVLKDDGDAYILHDPGLPPRPNCRVAKEVIWEAMGRERNKSEVTGVKFKPKATRADVILARQHPEYSRAALAKLFDLGLVARDGKQLKAGSKLLPGVVLDVDLSPLTPDNVDIDLPILYEDDNVVVVSKPAGVLTHSQGKFGTEASVATFLRHKVVGLEGDRAGVVHRLDRATSGVLVGAKNQQALNYLQKQFADRKTKKTYVAIVEGHLKQKEAIIDMPIERNPKAPATFRAGPNGKPAKTQYKVLAENSHASLVELKPVTGRTHQLRVHLQQIGHPIVGDPLYGKGEHGGRMYLHALSLELAMPATHEQKLFTAPLPPEFEEYMKS